MDKIICGIQQLGIGVANVAEYWKWYKDVFGVDVKILDAEGVAERMLPYTGGKPQPRYAILVYNLRGGAGFEIWEPRGRKLNYISFTPELGDYGIFAGKVKTPDASAAYRDFNRKGIDILGPLAENPAGVKHFFIRDPWGNIFDIEEDNYVFINEKKVTGGGNGAMLGVSDMERSIKFYSELTDFDKIVYDETGKFPDLTGVPGAEYTLRRVMLERSKPIQGPLCEVMGTSHIELVQRIIKNPLEEEAPRKLYEGRYWGDPGFIHLCFDIRNMEAVRKTAESLGHPFVCDSGKDFKMGEADGHFTYVEDPDGTLIEFVETFKIPVMKKLGIYIHLEKRDPLKPLPRYMTKALRFMRSK